MRQTFLPSNPFKKKSYPLLMMVLLLLLSFATQKLTAQNCNDAQLSGINGQIQITGLTAPIEIVDVYNANWQSIFHCDGGDCGAELTVPNLSAGVYHVNLQYYNANWGQICTRAVDVNVSSGSSGNQPDLSLANLSALPASLPRATTQTFSFDLKNNGSVPANGAYVIKMYLSLNQSLSSNDQLVGQIETGFTPVGTTANVVGAINAPGTVFPQSYYLLLVADADNSIAEFNETNNVLASNSKILVTTSGGGGGEQCGPIKIEVTGNAVAMEGAAGNQYYFKIHDLDNGWSEAFACTYGCGNRQTASNLVNGRYLVRVYDVSWNLVCEKEVNLSGGGGGGGGGGSCDDVTAVGGNGQIIVDNIIANAKIEIIGAGTNWVPQVVCEGNCNTQETISNLSAGSYNVKIQKPSPYCYAEKSVEVTGGGGTGDTKACLIKRLPIPTGYVVVEENLQQKSITLSHRNDQGFTYWTQTYNLNIAGELNHIFSTSVQTFSDHLILAISAVINGNSQNYILVKADLSGIEQWQKVSAAPIQSSAISIPLRAPNGGYYLELQDGRNSIYFVRVDNQGNQIWAQPVGGDLFSNTYGFEGALPDGSALYFTNIDRSNNFGTIYKRSAANGNTILTVDNNDFLTFDYCAGFGNSDQTVQCGEVTIEVRNNSIIMTGQSGLNYFFKIHDLNNGWAEVFACTHQCRSSQTAENIPNGRYLVRTYDQRFAFLCEAEITLGANSRSRQANVETFTAYPNPAEEQINIDLKEYAGEAATLSISNIYGQIVDNQRLESIPSEIVQIPLDDYVNGFYFINIQIKGKRLRSEKFLVKRLY